MTFDEQKLYELLPAIYRIRDAERVSGSGEVPPLLALLKIIAGQAQVIEANLAQLYDDQFVETGSAWTLPYLGDLIGIKGLPSVGLEALNPRSEVGHTIGYRRRKGTAAMLEQLARDVTGWPARAVEFFQLLATTQWMNHLRPENQSFISVRGAERLEYLNTPFEDAPLGERDLTHTVDVRRIASRRGRYNIPNVGIFLWRLRAFSLTRSPAVPAFAGNKRLFLFNPLGCDLPLFNLPETEDQVTHLAEPINVVDRIRRRVLRRNFESYYGDDKSFRLERPGANINAKPTGIPGSEIIVCNLTGWVNLPASKIAIDPLLGRIAFPSDENEPPVLTFHYGFSSSIGGGEYNRITAFGSTRTEVLDPQGRPIVKKVTNSYSEDSGASSASPTITQALADLALTPKGGAVEILNSGRYVENLTIDATGRTIILRAADKHRPVIVMDDDLFITGDKEVTLDGLMIAGGAIKVRGTLARLRLRHCTLVPGISLEENGAPAFPDSPSLFVDSPNTRVEIEDCIMGAIRTDADAEVTISNSIVDATRETNQAYGGTGDFGAPLRITNSTVIGQVRARIIRLASNTIFLASFENEADQENLTAPVCAQRRQEGCVRFSYLSPGASVPVRYYCQPENETSLVRPQFTSTRFNDPAYCQLSTSSPCEIRRGADDEAAMGVFHDLYEPQRESHLSGRLQEYLRFGLEAGIFYVT
ncbi:MAG: hypothetical protein QOK48_220 [Blastocatellia bacterium]|jgi:hypothetical protein|nr:hypothetical protein [Blastocatellia bacterium]